MPKKIFFESAVHQFVMAAREFLQETQKVDRDLFHKYESCVSTWEFKYLGPKQMVLSWKNPGQGESLVEYPGAQFYVRGDDSSFVQKQKDSLLVGLESDPVSNQNRAYFKTLAIEILKKALNQESSNHGR